MRIFRTLDELTDTRGCVVSVGNFDGVHRGHLRLLETLRATANALGVAACVFTFDPHPGSVLGGGVVPPITWLERKLAILSQAGVDWLVVYPTDRQLLELSPEGFFVEILLKRLRIKGIVEGEDFCFGQGRSGDIRLLSELCKRHGLVCEAVPPVMWEGAPVSSSRIRQCLAQGDVRTAAELMARPFRTCGEVVRGAGRGTSLGFPTANLERVATLLPKAGIYAGVVPIGGRIYPAAISLGGNPTFGEDNSKFEVYIIDFAGDLYGEKLEVDFLEFLRDIKRFSAVQELIEQMSCDVQRTRKIVDDFRSQELSWAAM